MDTLGSRMVKYREAAGLSRRSVTDALGINYSTFASYERDLCKPSPELMPQIAKLYSCSVDDLLGIEKDSPEITEEPVSVDELVQFLKKSGFLEDGQSDISDSDLRFLKATIASLGEWFKNRNA